MNEKRTVKLRAEADEDILVNRVSDLLSLFQRPYPDCVPIPAEKIWLQLRSRPHVVSKDASARANGPEADAAPVRPAIMIWSCCSPKVVDKARNT